VSDPGLEPFLTPSLTAIGVARSAEVLHHEAPRQSGLGRGASVEIEVFPGAHNGLQDLEGFSHVWLLFWCHHARGRPVQVQPPRDAKKRGVFATRSPQRPNPIGLSCVRLEAIEKRTLRVSDCDLLDGTPVLDIKPYLAYCDSVPDARHGYVEQLSGTRGDHREWWRGRGVAPPARYRRRLRAEGCGDGGGDGEGFGGGQVR